MRKIPVTMTTQHPDHANVPYWHRNPLIRTHSEAYECFLAFSEFNCDEHMWDWEGKLVDESVLERLLTHYSEFFKSHPLGKEKFLTFRLPNPKIETEFRLGRALMNILLTSSLAQQLKLPASPLFEVVLPMTESEEELINIQTAYQEITTLKHPLYRLEKGVLQHVEIIPLFEQISTLIRSNQIIKKYLDLHQKNFKFLPQYLRPFIARSDPALNSGIVPVMLAIKIALARYAELEKSTGVKMFPIVGVGSLPFRGSLRPTEIKSFVEEYRGCKTVLIQSAFRYDFEKSEVIKGIALLNTLLPKTKARKVTKADEKSLLKCIPIFENHYTSTIEAIAPTINNIAQFIPKRRERMQHIGLFGYSRSVGGIKLPRAIGFTAALYSLGIPPELIGTGRGLAEAEKLNAVSLIEKYYVNIRADLTFAGRFLNKSNLKKLAASDTAWQSIADDVAAIEKFLGQELQPSSSDDHHHCELTTEIYEELQTGHNLTLLIEQAAILRKSLG